MFPLQTYWVISFPSVLFLSFFFRCLLNFSTFLFLFEIWAFYYSVINISNETRCAPVNWKRDNPLKCIYCVRLFLHVRYFVCSTPALEIFKHSLYCILISQDSIKISQCISMISRVWKTTTEIIIHTGSGMGDNFLEPIEVLEAAANFLTQGRLWLSW